MISGDCINSRATGINAITLCFFAPARELGAEIFAFRDSFSAASMADPAAVVQDGGMSELSFFQSIRGRLYVPLAAVTLLAAVIVAIVAYESGGRAAQRGLERRFEAISSTLSEAAFPLTPAVLETLADLTGTWLVTVDASGAVIHSTEPLDPEIRRGIRSFVGDLASPRSETADTGKATVPGQRVRLFRRKRLAEVFDATAAIIVLFDEQALRQQQQRAAIVPLATGLSTVMLLALVSGFFANRLVSRISVLEDDVQRIAAGDFDFEVIDPGQDEIARLASHVEQMRRQLSSLRTKIHDQERQRLIHQLGASLAHQLRNSLTGARMAVQLHADECRSCQDHTADQQAGDALSAQPPDEALEVALRELRRTESYVSQLLSVAAQQASDAPGLVSAAIARVQDSVSPVAQHHGVDVQWVISRAAVQVTSARALEAAVQNLVFNAIQAGGDRVRVRVQPVQGRVEILVEDNGPGPDLALAENLFDTFVTSKPEGLGIGLAIVKQTAERMGGTATWTRVGGWTRFQLEVQVAK